jgi:hypothetical protein
MHERLPAILLIMPNGFSTGIFGKKRPHPASRMGARVLGYKADKISSVG